MARCFDIILLHEEQGQNSLKIVSYDPQPTPCESHNYNEQKRAIKLQCKNRAKQHEGKVEMTCDMHQTKVKTGGRLTLASSDSTFNTKKSINEAATRLPLLSRSRQSDHQKPSAPRIRRVHTRVALTRSLVRVAWLMVELKM